MEQKPDIVLSIENLRVTFETFNGTTEAVRNTSFSLERGQTLALVGESGSGKSVTGYSILRLIQPPGRITAGKIIFNPKNGPSLDIAGLAAKSETLFKVRGGKIAMIFQEPMTALSPVHTIGNQICEAIRLHQTKDKREAEKLAMAMLAKVGITNPEKRLRQYPFEFSGGMRQRVVIAMALVCRPEILIADEPTTALDVTVQAQILELIRDLQRETGTSVIFITHDLGVVAQVAQQVVVMQHGRIVEAAPVRELFAQPYHPYTQRLLASIPDVGTKETIAAPARHAPKIPPGFSLGPQRGGTHVEPVLKEIAPNRQLLLWPIRTEEAA